MIKEIGSEYWLTELPHENSEGRMPSWLKKWPNVSLTSSGRGAIDLAIKATANSVIAKTALLPAYCCHSVIDPFNKNNFEVFFYDINKNLEPDIKSIEKYLDKKIGIFLHMGYFGFGTNNNLNDQFTKLKMNGTFIIEDVTHTLFSNYNRSKLNDFYIGSIRKWLGIPSGAFFSSEEKINIPDLTKDSLFSTTRKTALEIKGKYIKTDDQNLKPQFLKLFETAEETLDMHPEAYSMDDLSLTILKKADIEYIKSKRRENYLYLLSALKIMSFIEIVFKELPDNYCPLFFPAYIPNIRESVQREFIENQIYTPIHWPKPIQVNQLNNTHSKYIYNNILSIPCDQRYGLEEMERITYLLNSFNKDKKL